jgi:hypothetical protein
MPHRTAPSKGLAAPTTLAPLALLVVLGCLPGLAGAQSSAVDEHFAKLKQSLQKSAKQLQTYEWIETTVVTVDGAEKARQQDRCYHGADGTFQQVPVDGGSSEAAPSGRRLGRRERLVGGPVPRAAREPRLGGRMAERQAASMEDYIHQAVDLVHQYVPPDPKKLQAARAAGKLSIDLLDPGKRVRLDFHDYLKPGDVVGIEIDTTTDTIEGLSVQSYLADQADAVSLKVEFGTLNDGTTYPSRIVLDAPAKKVEATVSNTGYRKM